MFRTALRRTPLAALSAPAKPNCLPAALLARRTYADAPAHSDKLKLSFSVPHQSIYVNKEVYRPHILVSSGGRRIDVGA